MKKPLILIREFTISLSNNKKLKTKKKSKNLIYDNNCLHILWFLLFLTCIVFVMLCWTLFEDSSLESRHKGFLNHLVDFLIAHIFEHCAQAKEV